MVHKKITKSKDFEFFDDQIIAKFDELEKPKSIDDELVDPSMVHPSILCIDDKRDV